MDIFSVNPLKLRDIAVSVPASKSVLNRAILLSAFTPGRTQLLCGSYAEDTRSLLDCLDTLQIPVERGADGLVIEGNGGRITPKGPLFMGSGGTVARFLTAMLAVRGGEYELHASRQMESRPMDADSLRAVGAELTFLGKPNSLPFLLKSSGQSRAQVTVDTDTSTQFASGLMLAAAVGKAPFQLCLTGSRTRGSYLRTTESVIGGFGASVSREDDTITILPTAQNTPFFEVEPDVSGACYFYALALLCAARVKVRGVHRQCLQTDIKFLTLLEERGVKISEEKDGVTADGRGVSSFEGFRLNMQDFSDQSLTVAALAPFASSPTRIDGIGHIRRQECDRIEAIRDNLTRLGVPCNAGEDFVEIIPASVKKGRIKTFGDHRVAMAFSLIGLRQGGIEIEDPACCKKTFPAYFDILSTLI